MVWAQSLIYLLVFRAAEISDTDFLKLGQINLKLCAWLDTSRGKTDVLGGHFMVYNLSCPVQ